MEAARVAAVCLLWACAWATAMATGNAAHAADLFPAPYPNTSVSWERYLSCMGRETLDSPHQLYSCVKDVAVQHSELMRRLRASSDGPRPLSVAIVTFVTPEIEAYAAYALSINLFFAIHHHHTFDIVDLTHDLAEFDRHDARWNKIKALSNALMGSAATQDYVLWLDADLVVLDLGYDLGALVAAYPLAHLLASAEHAGSSTLINSGALLLRNHAYSRELLARWWGSAEQRRLLSDQEAFDLLRQAVADGRLRSDLLRADDLRERVAVLAPEVLNSDPPAMTQLQATHRVLHLMGEEESYRSRAFRQGLEDILRHAVPLLARHEEYDRRPRGAALSSPQLSLSQPALLALALEEYFPLAQRLIRAFDEESRERGLAECRQLSNAAHHYLHALEHVAARPGQLNQHEGVRRAVMALVFDGVSVPADRVPGLLAASVPALRAKVYNLLKRNLLAIRRRYAANFRTPQGIDNPERVQLLVDFPELVKTTATAGQHLLRADASADKGRGADDEALQQEWRQQELVAIELHALCREMMRRAHPSQHPAVQHMVAFLHHQQGLLALAAQDLPRAHHHFESTYNLTFPLAQQAGDYLLVQPLHMMASTLSMMGSHEVALKMFARAVEISQKTADLHPAEHDLVVRNHRTALAEAGRRVQRP